MKLKKFIKDIKFKLWYFKVFQRLIRSEKVSNWVRMNLCAYGFHKTRVNGLSIKESGKRARKVFYLKCRFCNFMFFASKKQKDKYAMMTNPKQNPLDESPVSKHKANVKKEFKSVGSGGDGKVKKK